MRHAGGAQEAKRRGPRMPAGALPSSPRAATDAAGPITERATRPQRVGGDERALAAAPRPRR
eukprot:scaffold1334_cov344-Prasinococcus_capsulatus_cf.AAC.8